MPINLTLLDKYGQVHDQAGLNWGYSSGHVCLEDAYIPLKTETLKNNIGFFPPLSANNTINVTWDDGIKMVCLLEGRQTTPINNNYYAKQISSFGDKSILGTYLRTRLGIFNRKITLNDLSNYGRTDITVTKLSNRNYLFDFSIT